MSKQKAKVKVFVNDGKGSLIESVDHRFDTEPWLINFEVPSESADEWMSYLSVECKGRQWSMHGISQIEASENSGSYTIVSKNPTENIEILLIWERTKMGPLLINARPKENTTSYRNITEKFFASIDYRLKEGVKNQFYLKRYLYYSGTPWRGELWLDNKLRLSPPQKFPKSIHGPQVIIIEATVESVSFPKANSEFDLELRKLTSFLSVLLAQNIRIQRNEQMWTWNSNQKDIPTSEVREIGYWEKSSYDQMPTRGTIKQIPMKTKIRLNPDPFYYDEPFDEVVVPDDACILWGKYKALTNEDRNQFLQACSAYKLALELFPDHDTAQLAFYVIACESLKPRFSIKKKRDSRQWNIFSVVNKIHGEFYEKKLRDLPINPQNARDKHLHFGDFLGNELKENLMSSTYSDPSYREVLGFLRTIANATIIKWLEIGGKIDSIS